MLDASLLGERLRLCRLDLSFNGELPDVTLAEVAQGAQLPEQTVHRLEHTGQGTAVELAALLTYYVKQDRNMRWVLLPDNTDIPSYLLADRWPWPNFTKAFVLVQELSQHMQQVTLEAQTHLTLMLPLDRYTPEELVNYQRELPPVRAAQAGWQSRVHNLRPLHFYPAGEFVPACGSLAEALLYDSPTRPRAVTAAKCKTCLRRLAQASRVVRPI